MDAMFWNEDSGSVWDPDDEGLDGAARSSLDPDDEGSDCAVRSSGSRNISRWSDPFSVTG